MDPQNAKLHNGIGDIYLNKLDRPREAEGHYREALRMDPRNHDYQKDLFSAVARCSLIYRLVSLPSREFEWIGALAFGIRKKPWLWWWLVVLICFTAVIIYFTWLVLATLPYCCERLREDKREELEDLHGSCTPYSQTRKPLFTNPQP